MTDSQGRVVGFKNAIIILTSNLGSQAILEESDHEEMKRTVMGYVQAHFRPEFVNRIDEYIIFQALQLNQIQRIVKLQVQQYTHNHIAVAINTWSLVGTVS